jgi:hypothetical protein
MTNAVGTRSVDKPPTLTGLLAAVLVGTATLTSYVVFLGWDQTKEPGPDGNLHGPHEVWQVVGIVVALGLIAAAAGWRRHPWVAVIVTTVVMTACFSIQGARDPLNDGLWPVGAILVAFGTFAGVATVALVAAILASRSAASVG